MPAVAAVVLLLVAAPLIAPGVMEKSADMAVYDTKSNTESLKYEMAMDSVMEEDKMVLDVAETVEEAAPETGEIVSDDADNGACIVLHFLVVDKVQDMNLLAIDKEHIGPICDCYLIEVDGEEKILGVPPMEEEVALEAGMWYDLMVTDSTEYGIDYIWTK